MFKRFFTSLVLVATVAMYGCGGGGGSSGGLAPITTLTLGSITITPANPSSIAVGASQQFTAAGISTTSLPMTLTSVTWKSSNTAFATIDASGVATAVAAGSTQITATSGTIVSPAITLTVTAAPITIAPITIAGLSGTSGLVDGTGTAARFKNPNGITTTDGINLYVADTENHSVRKIVISSGAVTTIATLPPSPNSAVLYGITKVGDNLYVTDGFNHAIYRIDILANPAQVTTFAGSLGTSGSADGTGAAARFNQPIDITTDGTNLYVADSLNFSIRQIEIATQDVTTIANVENPRGITFAGGSLYVTDNVRNIILKIAPPTGTATTWANTTFAGSLGTSGSADGTGTAAQFNSPHGISSNGNNLYVAEYHGSTASIRKIEISTGTVSTVYTANNSILPLGITVFSNTLYTTNNDSTITSFFGGLIN